MKMNNTFWIFVAGNRNFESAQNKKAESSSSRGRHFAAHPLLRRRVNHVYDRPELPVTHLRDEW